MAGRIQSITVEIGGDTTKLQKEGRCGSLKKSPHPLIGKMHLQKTSGVCDYATRSFRIDPHNNHAHIWLIQSFIKNKNNKLARDAFQNAGNLLSGEDYGEMLIHLNKMAPGFVRENQS